MLRSMRSAAVSRGEGAVSSSGLTIARVGDVENERRQSVFTFLISFSMRLRSPGSANSCSRMSVLTCSMGSLARRTPCVAYSRIKSAQQAPASRCRHADCSCVTLHLRPRSAPAHSPVSLSSATGSLMVSCVPVSHLLSCMCCLDLR